MGTPTDVLASGLDARVAAAAARALRLPPEIVGLDVPFARLGLDSLGCVELAAALEVALGIPVPADAVVESTTVRSLCAVLSDPMSASVLDRIRADVDLGRDIHPRPFTGAASLIEAREVLLTGVTGFLGSALLDALLTQTSAHVTCLVRKPGVRSPFRRSEVPDRGFYAPAPRQCRNGDLTPDQEPNADLTPGSPRVEFVEGDLTQPSAGLTADAWRRLVARTDAVCHAGASINWVAGYDALRDVNVLGTREMLRLAAEAGAAFHFVSSVSVCYSTAPPGSVDERYDPIDGVHGLHFGYAQSKAVAESLVRQAQARGLRARIYRPAMISGDSRTGRFNRDDMLSRLIAGCARMGAAPDLDWRLDALPVDTVAALILALSNGASAAAWHLAHPRPRHWRECVLWMRLYGYDVTLLPYREWTARLRQAVTDPDHPLRPLRSFFLDEPSDGLTIPELHEQSRATHLDMDLTSAAIAGSAVRVPSLDADLMDRYFSAFVDGGVLPAPARRHPRRLGGLDVRALGVTPFATGHSIIGELTAWQSGGAYGHFRVPGPGGRPLVLKIASHADDVRAVGEALAGICAADLDTAYRELGDGLGSVHGHAREIALYRLDDPVLRSHTPGVIATHADPTTRTWAVLLEDLRGATLLDAVDRPGAWTRDHVNAVLDGIAAIHGAFHSRSGELRSQPWMPASRTRASVQAMTPLWRALAVHAAPMFTEWAGPTIAATHRALIDRIAQWRPVLDAAPHTLIHNDFNPRNVCLRSADDDGWRLCAYDWELAAIGTPMRDLAEFLCFVSPPDVRRGAIEALIDRHADRFSRTAGVHADRAEWRAAFGAALAELLIDRLSVYAMVHRVRPQSFLPRVLRSWSALHSLFPADGFAG
jgi:thioester reductase-like protein